MKYNVGRIGRAIQHVNSMKDNMTVCGTARRSLWRTLKENIFLIIAWKMIVWVMV